MLEERAFNSEVGVLNMEGCVPPMRSLSETRLFWTKAGSHSLERTKLSVEQYETWRNILLRSTQQEQSHPPISPDQAVIF
jgi:hypothetical protein